MPCSLPQPLEKNIVYQIPHENENLSAYGIGVKNSLNDFYSLPDTYQKTHSFPVLTRSSSATSYFVNKNRTHAFSMKYHITHRIQDHLLL